MWLTLIIAKLKSKVTVAGAAPMSDARCMRRSLRHFRAGMQAGSTGNTSRALVIRATERSAGSTAGIAVPFAFPPPQPKFNRAEEERIMRSRSSCFVAIAAILVGCCAAGCTATSARTARMTAFEFTSPTKRVVLVNRDVELGELTAGGVFEARADWTQAAQRVIEDGVRAHFAKSNAELVTASNVTPHIIQLANLHDRVGEAILLHLYGAGAKLPNKADALDWTLGPGTNEMRERYGADYALFVYVHDSYSTAGRRALQVAGALFGVIESGGEQLGFASLVDLRTGNIVWFNVLDSASGDLRATDSAESSINSLLRGIPL